MALSIFDLFKVGVGPSSSHTVGPMVAANRFLAELAKRQQLSQVVKVKVALYGSLALTGKGHATDIAVLLGLLGEAPATVNPDRVPEYIQAINTHLQLKLAGEHLIRFNPADDIHFHCQASLPEHPNGMQILAYDQHGMLLFEGTYFSVGGGFVVTKGEKTTSDQDVTVPLVFNSGKELLSLCQQHQLSIAELVLKNEQALQPDLTQQQLYDQIYSIWEVMDSCIRRGCQQSGELPGGLKIKRRAAEFYRELTNKPEAALKDQLTVMDWVNLFAMAVNEENAAGGRVVTAPTNGAAGVIPAVLAYYDRFVHGASREGIVKFMATATAIGMLYKQNASISAAEVGCQGEIGVACSMAAGALTAVLGGTNEQVENAAEIGMEHNLGLTCDPIAGLVQVPCIERNTMGAVKAINAARLAIRGNGDHHVSLDSVIETMRQTGLDMQEKYKETSQGGLAVNVVAC
ncbi:L-serine ammonia-lyase [Spartinivicinus poritis]|uniref:L-serine dehydratase n=1 Tax=Spartinivicinus poritis TaxID=2994640 RepID=A0ABT5UDS3_9GAMM|nr:L-serine ammonia-lyase [Spartinivicinus sp. A2-2]MDE1464510.1 L-serine ammonia-lyase [Spartinivicinus sp. A2-2]